MFYSHISIWTNST